MKKYLIILICVLMTISAAYAQHQELRNQIAQIAHASSGRIGVAIRLLENEDTLSYHDQEHYVMHSVFKFAIAMTVLNEVDKGRFKLDQPLFITKADLPENYSPLRDKYPDGNVNITIRELLSYMVTVSDNDACDILLKQLGGAKKVNDFVHLIGVKNIVIKVSEADMAASWPAQYNNWCYPSAQIELLKKLYHQTVLSKTNNDLLWQFMLNTYVCPKRIRGLLPEGTPLIHRTGTSATNDQGLSPGTNDAGIIILPNGKHLAVSIFVADSHDDMPARELIIARIARAAYDEFSK